MENYNLQVGGFVLQKEVDNDVLLVKVVISKRFILILILNKSYQNQ
jgi:hypothetical protein